MSSEYSSSDELNEKRTHGGRRKGSGRKPLPPHLKKARRKFFEERNKQIRLRRELIYDLEAWGEKHGMKKTSYSDIIALGFEIIKREEEREKQREAKLKKTVDTEVQEPPLLRFKKQKLVHPDDEEVVSSPSSQDEFSYSEDVEGTYEDADQRKIETLNKDVINLILKLRREVMVSYIVKRSESDDLEE